MGQHSMCTWKQISTDRNLISTDRVWEKLTHTGLLDGPCCWFVLKKCYCQKTSKMHGPWLKSARGVFRQFNAHGSFARGVFGQITSHGSLHGPCWTLTAGMEKVCQLSFERWSPTNQLQQLYFLGFVYINSSHNLKWRLSTPITHSKHLTFICDQIHFIQSFV